VLNPDGSVTIIPGKSYASFGTMSVIKDPGDKKGKRYMVVQQVRMEVPTKQASGEGPDKSPGFDTYSTQDHFIVLNKNGVGTGTKSKVEKEITDSQKKKNYDNGYSNLNRLGKEKLKQNTGNNVQGNNQNTMYEYQGGSWTYQELKGAGWTDSQIQSLNKK
jgi:hypothetical protein